ncbi:MAG TPA: hypothetical protein VEK76_11275 [Candidatus Binatia bacterium]|nr:hypothetical protein [Candidatus Binatia bacterium]
MNADDHEEGPFSIFRWYGFGSPIGIAVLLIALGGFLVLLAEAISLPLSLFR